MLPESRKTEMFASPMKYMAYPKIRLINSRKTAILTVCRRADLKILVLTVAIFAQVVEGLLSVRLEKPLQHQVGQQAENCGSHKFYRQ